MEKSNQLVALIIFSTQHTGTVARSLPQKRDGSSQSLAVEKISEIYNIQRLKVN